MHNEHKCIAVGKWSEDTPWQFFTVEASATLPDLTLCTAAFCVVTYKKKLLIIEHKTRGFELPGGHIDPEEDIATTVKREVLEEAGAQVDKLKYFGYKKVSPPIPISYRDNSTKFYPFPHSYIPYFVTEAVEILETPLAGDVKKRILVSIQEAVRLFAPGHQHELILLEALRH